MRNWVWGLAALCAVTVQAVDFVLTEESITIREKGLDPVSALYPQLNVAGRLIKPTQIRVTGQTAQVTYAQEGSAQVTVSAECIAVSFDKIPAGLKETVFELLIPLSYAEGCRWTIKDKSGAFPSVKKSVKLYQGNAGDFSVQSAGEARLAMLMPETYSWQELQDNREWNWDTFELKVTTPYNPDKQVITLPFGASVEALEQKRQRVESALTSSAEKKPAQKVAVCSASLTDKGVTLACGSMGTFDLAYPVFFAGSEKLAPVETSIHGAKAVLLYKNEGRVELDLTAQRCAWQLVRLPQGAQHVGTEMFIPFTFCGTGAWRVDGKDGVFPKEKKPGGKLFQGHGQDVTLIDINQEKLTLKFPQYTFLEVQDNREWNWSIFLLSVKIPCTPDLTCVEIPFGVDVSQFQQVVLVDAFGQVSRSFPDKITSEAELKQDAQAEAAYYQKLPDMPYARNSYGGVTDSGKKLGLRATGFFHVQKLKSGRWVLVDPLGDAFFHLGICSFGPAEDYTSIEGRKDSFAWLPPHTGTMAAAWHEDTWWNSRAVSFYKANLVRKYGSYDARAHLNRLVERVKRVGFNSVGAFTGNQDLFVELKFPMVATLPLSEWQFVKSVPGVRGVFDPFEKKNAEKMDQLFREKVAPAAKEPLLMGYFLANEQGFEDLPRAIPQLTGGEACKKALVDLLRAKYPTLAAFNAAWGVDAASFDDLEKRGLPVTTQAAFADMQAYTEHFLEAYFKLIATTFRRYDPNHMLIGNRWQPGTANSEALCRIAGRYMDVISINYYCAGIDKAFIERIYRWSGQLPQFWSEFYYTAEKESNAGPSNTDLPTQTLRGQAYRYYVEQAAVLGFVVGIEWFTLIDQAATGRFFEGLNGERANTGLFNVADRPYRALFTEMNQAHATLYDVWLAGRKPFQISDPRFLSEVSATKTVHAGLATAPITINGQLEGWPGRPPERISANRITSGRETKGFEGAFKVAWDTRNLYVLVNVSDATPMCNDKEPASYWNGDCVELFIGTEKVEEGGALRFSDRHILISAAAANRTYVIHASSQPTLETAVVRSVDNSGYTVEVAVPWTLLGITPNENSVVLFDLAIDNGDTSKGRTTQIMWNGSARNSSDRGAWGRLKLMR